MAASLHSWISILAAVLLALPLVASRAAATVIEVAYSGTLTSVTDPGGTFGGAGVGSPFSGTLTIDLDTPDSDAVPVSGWYFASEGTIHVELEVGGVSLSSVLGSDLVSLRLVDVPSEDDLFVMVDAYELSGVPTTGSIGMTLTDLSSTALVNDLLTDAPFDLSAWPDAHVLDVFGVLPSFEQFSFQGEIEAMGIVPEPATALLLGLGLLALAGRRPARRVPGL